MQKLFQLLVSLLAVWFIMSLSAFSQAELNSNKVQDLNTPTKCENKDLKSGFVIKCSETKTSQMFLRKNRRAARKAYA